MKKANNTFGFVREQWLITGGYHRLNKMKFSQRVFSSALLSRIR
jgi:hypothetical protein